jgi:nucleotidyltransferase/DNA polymerase involved in DNA repair
MNITDAILHIDGDSFFASCETSLNPKLRGKPVVTGQERGIASAMSKEAKALGVSRGMPIYQIRKLFPEVIVLSSDYSTYELFSQRMFAIVRRYADRVEEYSIDECFAMLESWDSNIIMEIKQQLEKELSMTFSLGLAPTKVLAKLASSKNKPDGLTILDIRQSTLFREFLEDIDIGKVWGIGSATANFLRGFGVKTALDLRERQGEWVRENLAKPIQEIWHELNGVSIYKVLSGREGDSTRRLWRESIQATRTFSPLTNDKVILLSELSRNIERASVKARRGGQLAGKICYFLKTREFQYCRHELNLSLVTNSSSEIASVVRSNFDSVYNPSLLYRATGVTLSNFVDQSRVQNNLFNNREYLDKWQEIFDTVDKLEKHFGTKSIALASSLVASRRRNESGFIRRLSIPYLGEVN